MVSILFPFSLTFEYWTAAHAFISQNPIQTPRSKATETAATNCRKEPDSRAEGNWYLQKGQALTERCVPLLSPLLFWPINRLNRSWIMPALADLSSTATRPWSTRMATKSIATMTTTV